MTADHVEIAAEASKRIVGELVGQFGTAPHTRRIAEQAARFLAVAERARLEVDRDGLVVLTTKGAYRHPAIEVERTMRLSYLHAIKLLESPRRGKIGKPPMGEALGKPRTRAATSSRFFKSA